MAFYLHTHYVFAWAVALLLLLLSCDTRVAGHGGWGVCLLVCLLACLLGCLVRKGVGAKI